MKDNFEFKVNIKISPDIDDIKYMATVADKKVIISWEDEDGIESDVRLKQDVEKFIAEGTWVVIDK